MDSYALQRFRRCGCIGLQMARPAGRPNLEVILLSAPETGAPDYEGGGLSRETNWWGAFVIGLAGTILVTGIAPVMVTSLGAAAIPVMVIVTVSGYLLCLLLA